MLVHLHQTTAVPRPRVPSLAFFFWLTVAAILLLLTILTVPVHAQSTSPCALHGPNRSVTICRPVTGVTYDSPIRVLAAASHTQPVLAMQVYLDGTKLYQVSGDAADTNLILKPGTHHLTVKAVDAVGNFTKSMDVVIRTRLYPRAAYITNSNDQTLSVFSMEAASGFLRQNGYVLAGAKPSGVAETWRGFVYATGGTSGQLYAYRKSYAGRLLPVAGSPYACGSDCRAVAIDPTGKFVFTTDYASNAIRGFLINASTGALTPIAGSPFASGTNPNAAAISCRGILFVTNEGSNNVSAFAIDSVSGALTPAAGSPFATGLAPRAVAVDPFGYRLYVANYGGNSISAFRIAVGGTLSSMGAAIKTGSGPSSITVYPSGAFLYVTHSSANSVGAFKLDLDGALKPIGTVASGPQPAAISLDVQGSYALVVNAGAPYELWEYKVDLTTGVLKFVRGTRTRGSGVSLAVASTNNPIALAPGYLYAGTANASNYTGKVFAFSVNPNGSLTSVAGSPFAHSRGVTALAPHPMGNMLYAPGLKLPHESGGMIAQYWVNRSTSALTSVAPYENHEEFQSRSMVVDPSGRFAYAASGDGIMEPYFTGLSVTAGGGPISDWLFYPGGGPFESVLVDPTGKYLYLDEGVYMGGGSAILGINPLTGDFASYDSPSQSIRRISIDPMGRFAYTLGGDQILSHYVSGSTGKLIQVGSALATGSGPAMIVVDPYARFVYVANKNSNTISAYKSNPGNGTLTAIGSYPAGTGPVGLTIDITGTFLYVVNEASLDVTGYKINPTSGALSALAGSPFRLLAPGTATSLTMIGKVN